MEKEKNEVAVLLHEMFSDDAIESAALIEKIEDVGWLIEHNLYYNDKKMKQMYDECERFHSKDNGRTLNDKNIAVFKVRVREIPRIKRKHLLEGLTEKERFAYRRLLYYGEYK